VPGDCAANDLQDEAQRWHLDVWSVSVRRRGAEA